MAVIVAFDQGTTSSRAIVFDSAGAMLGVAQREFKQHYPQPGWVEHDAEEIWKTQLDVGREVLAQCGLTAQDVAAIGITNQRETTMVWDRATGKPIHRAIVWQDRRTAADCDALRAAGHDDLVQRKTGLLIDAYFCATKLRWLLENVPGARKRAQAGELAFGTIDSWLIWRLTGGRVHATDVTNASRTMLLNIDSGQWDDELLSLFDIPRTLLPEVLPSSHVYGQTEASLFGAPIKIAGAAGDQQAALFGQNCTSNGMAKNTYGTGCFALMNIGKSQRTSRHRLLTTIACTTSAAREYALEGSVFIAGAAVQWLRDGLGIIKSSADVEPLAASVEDSDGLYMVPAFAGLGAPHWDSYARGTIVGITRGTTAAHLARAALEGIAFQVAEVLDAMKRDAEIPITELRVDGGAANNNLLMQFQADILGVPVVRPRIVETTALGAAYLAGLAVGFWDGIEQIESVWQSERVFSPQMSEDEVCGRRHRWTEALNRSRQWIDPA
jgi:glycerol kinase